MTGLVMALTDIVVLAVVSTVVVLVRWLIGGEYTLGSYFRLWPLLGLFVLAYAVSGLYPGAPVSPTKEVRKLSMATMMVFFAMGTLTFFSRDAQAYSRAVLIVALFASLIAVPLARDLVRKLLSHQTWWGYNAVMVGVDSTMHRLIRRLRRQSELGIKPTLVYSTHASDSERYMSMPLLHDYEQLHAIAKQRSIQYAIISIDGLRGLSSHEMENLIENLSATFKHLIVIPRARAMASLWASALDMGGTLGLCVEHRLLDRHQRMLKRVLDLAMALAFLPVLLPVMLGIAIAIRLDSPGRAIFRQGRLGRNGRPFRIYKFRTMVCDAENKLAECMKQNPELREQWERCQKFADDPRVTRMGKWLRKTSLDELPQIFNVLRGEMSLVGPRPIIEDEIPRYHRYYKVYCAVPPGVTGIWQVSGRNLVPYNERVQMDVYYVRNWSIWLDMHLIFRTVSAILLRRGAR